MVGSKGKLVNAFGRELVELADEVISAGKVHSPGALLSELLSKAEVMAPARPRGAEHINPTSPAALFDAFTSDKLPGLREYFNQFFEVVAFPNSSMNSNLQSGDFLVRRALGEGNLAHVALLVTGEALRAKELVSMGLRPESWHPGLYAEVIDAGPFPHRHEDKFARRLGDENGQLSCDSLILRIRQSESPLNLARVAAFGEVMPEPAKTKHDEVRDRPQILVVDDKDEPVADGEYAFHQGELSERGKFSEERKGRAYFSKIDPTQPFMFEVRDRVCAIRAGAFFNPDDPKIEYGGTWFDWTLVRDDKQADKNFWPYYQQEMDLAVQTERDDTAFGRRIDRFLQHEHITRRPIQVAKPFLAQLSKVRIRATPARVRVGPFVRYADHERAVIWIETVTPTMVRVRYKKAGAGAESSRYTSTVRVGGRHFAAVEVDGLAKDAFHNYTVELAPLPASGIPIAPEDFANAFPKLTPLVAGSMKEQLKVPSLDETEWLTFRTLRPKYDNQLRFATGSCRWYPGDRKNGKDWRPDMLDGLGKWLRTTPKEKWPHFLFFGGDQIYADEIGDDHGEMLIWGRFAARIPGPVGPAASVRDKLIDGAWAGRFAHRYKAYKDPDMEFVERVKNDLKELDELKRKYPEIGSIYHRYPKTGITDKESRVLKYQLMWGLTWALGGKVTDQKTYDKALNLLQAVDKLNVKSGSYRIFLPHWAAGFSSAVRRNPMAHRYLSHNFLLWEIPIFEPLLPTVGNAPDSAMVLPNHRGHLAATGGKHTADFAEYAYLYERAWTTSRNVRVLHAQIPTFFMFDDHEVTDDWNFDASWVRMLHNDKDAFGMWPKTLTDGLAAYWVYQGWCNKAPSQWKSDDPRVKALADARRQGIDALPELRRCIHRACFTPAPPKDPKASYQTGLSLDWHYRLPFDPPFLVPDCRSRRLMAPADDEIRIINHDDPNKRPMSQTIDEAQLDWMRKTLVDKRWEGPVAFIAPSTPLLMQKKVMDIMMKPETTAEAWDQGNMLSFIAAAAGSTKLGTATNALLRVFRKAKDLEHMIRDRSWRDLWGLVDAMRNAGSPVKTLVLVSGDVHHNYCMTANLPGSGRPKPELLQITCSGLQTEIRSSAEKWLAEKLGDSSFHIGKYRLVPGFMFKNNTGSPDLALFQNAAALVKVTVGPEVNVQVDYLSGEDTYTYLYTSGAAYMTDGEPSDSPWQKGRPRLVVRGKEQAEAHATWPSIGHGSTGVTEEPFDAVEEHASTVGAEEPYALEADELGEIEPEWTVHEFGKYESENLEFTETEPLSYDDDEAESETGKTSPRAGSIAPGVENDLGGSVALRPHYRAPFESGAPEPETGEKSYGWEQETAEGLGKKLKHLSLLPHFVEWGRKKVPLDPGLMNPGFYDGADKYKLASKLQDCLNAVMKKKQFSHIKVVLVDLTKSNSQPEFAGVHYTDQVSAANIPKLAAMLAAFQLRHDLRVALQKKGVDKLDILYEQVRDDWAATQINPHKLVLVGKSKIDLVDPKSPQLEIIFARVPPGDPVTIEFSSTGEDHAQLEVLADAFRDAKSGSNQKLDDLGFAERLRLMMTDKTRASDYMTSTIIRDLGYAYIASTLLQSGLYDPKRGGGLWLGADYARGKWRGPLAGGDPQSANAGSLAAFLTLLDQGSLVDPQSSADMLALIKKDPTLFRTTLGFMQGFLKLRDEGSIESVHAKRGVDQRGTDECALITRQVDTAAGKDSMRYIAIGLRAKTTREMENLIVDLDKCILANNKLTPAQGGHPEEHEAALPDAWSESPPAESLASEEEYAEDEAEASPITEEEIGIIGRKDDRVHVRDTLAVPFRWICRIWVQRRVKTPGHEEKRGLAPAGTGLLISPRHVLTAAHLLHGVEERGSVVEEHEALHVEVAPAADGDVTPFGRIEATSWHLPPKWKPTSHSSQFDYAVITLKEAVDERTLKTWKGTSLCFWGSPTCGANTSLDAVPSALAKKLIGARVLTAGYPTAKKGEMWCAAGKLSAGSATDAHLIKQGIVEDWAKKAGTFFLSADASEGQSGSPVWIVDSGKRYLVGVLVSIGEKNNTALNLREEVVRQIQSWTGQTTAGEETEKLFEDPEWFEERSDDIGESGEEMFESPSAFTTVGESLAKPEEEKIGSE